MQIGGLKLKNPFVAAPMAGISGPAFRLLAKGGGASLVCTEMVSARALADQGARGIRAARIYPEERPVALQLFGAEPAVMRRAARLAAELEPDLIDLNLGCPARKVRHQGAGSALLEDPPRAAALVAAAVFIGARKKKGPFAFGYVALLVLLVVGTLLSPTPMMSGSSLPSDCGLDVIASHEAAGAHLARLIPPGSLVYWQNDLSPLPLLYLLPGVRVFPPQLNHWYTYFQGGDPDQLSRQGFWNAELAAQWKKQADYVLIADAYVDSFNAVDNSEGGYDELEPTPPVLPCQSDSIIHVFRRVP